MWDAYQPRRDELTDMEWLQVNPHAAIDERFPGQVISYRVHIHERGGDLGDARIVYFHGDMKPHEIPHAPVVRAHWR